MLLSFIKKSFLALKLSIFKNSCDFICFLFFENHFVCLTNYLINETTNWRLKNAEWNVFIVLGFFVLSPATPFPVTTH